jgi:hypothetical protein
MDKSTRTIVYGKAISQEIHELQLPHVRTGVRAGGAHRVFDVPGYWGIPPARKPEPMYVNVI